MFTYVQDRIDPLIAAISASVIFIAVVAMVVLEKVFGLERLLVGRGATMSDK
jgi:putative spermidine/putrescine transport system permease protein